MAKERKMEPMFDLGEVPSKTQDKQVRFSLDKGIENIVGVFTDPIIVMPGGWGDTLPEWIKTTITLERLVENMKTLKGDEPTGTDAEACAYLYTASLEFPLDHDWAQIYLYIATKTYEAWRSKDSGVTMPEDIRVDKLDRNQEEDLRRLKAWIYRTKLKHRKGRLKDIEKEEKKQKAKPEEKVERPALFDF